MNTVQSSQAPLWLFPLTSMFNGLMVFINGYEFAQVVFLGKEHFYPFGMEGEVSWVYLSVNHYAIVSLVFMFLYAFGMWLSGRGAKRINHQLLWFSVFYTFIILLLQWINTQISVVHYS